MQPSNLAVSEIVRRLVYRLRPFGVVYILRPPVFLQDGLVNPDIIGGRPDVEPFAIVQYDTANRAICPIQSSTTGMNEIFLKRLESLKISGFHTAIFAKS